MNKTEAIRLLGGTNAAAAKAIGITPAAVSQWPDELPASISDRVVAAIAKHHLPPTLIGSASLAVPEPEKAGA